ncbi:MAG: glycosyl transferase family 4 [Candidatus Uhrbacteria bacterium GW2011_GWD2_52_7]|uniref:Glycosyl transferase family 4 n=1 Tax=Candidatus Uhrbacteria bacterium GW2011_GWD2_52_7 TaxID=1618989 RepID=A0A0G1ZRG4_9BACT|nr:MAG: glycosyl transferase family 4 [Candidatus Uhrbacteria bacterium GW2011_GWD2_52_7]
MPWWWPFPVGLAFVLATLLTPAVARVARIFGVVDRPDGERKFHSAEMPLLGGIAMYVGFVLPTLVMLVATDHLTSGDIDAKHIAGLLVGGAVLMIGGYLDDRYQLSPKYSVIAPVLAALIAVVSGIEVAKITNPLGGFVEIAAGVSTIVVFMWILGMTYTTKLLDGMDGLAGGVTAVGAMVIAALALSSAYFQPDVALLSLTFLAAILGFLMWNWHPATIFMGEGGSTFLGYTLGVLAIISGSKIATALLVMGIPALDVAIVIIRRLLAGQHPFRTSDRLHVHHLLLRLKLSESQVVIVYCSVALCFGVTTLVLSSWQKFVALGVLAAMVLGGVQHVLKNYR